LVVWWFGPVFPKVECFKDIVDDTVREPTHFDIERIPRWIFDSFLHWLLYLTMRILAFNNRLTSTYKHNNNRT
jgi:hypothetical protein